MKSKFYSSSGEVPGFVGPSVTGGEGTGSRISSSGVDFVSIELFLSYL